MKISKELAKGSTGLLVLSVLGRRDMYGYQIIREIGTLSGEVFRLNEGTLYPILHALEQEGFLTGYLEQRDTGRKRKYYTITPKGRRELIRCRTEWETYADAVERVVGGAGVALA
jgi:DNA-binding PadR family transcriptional regulator